jgi:hypothetical protein
MNLFTKMPGIRTGLLSFAFLIPGIILGQSVSKRVLSKDTDKGIGYANVGIIGKNVGTVTDARGGFTLIIDDIYNNDSLRFFMIGYEPRSFLVSDLKSDSMSIIYLNPIVYRLDEVKVIYHKPRKIKLGTEVNPNEVRAGFASNNLGSELAVKIHLRGLVNLEDINLNIGVCTFDSVTYRLNVYQADSQGNYNNILTSPIYLSFSKDKINNVITFDLKKYDIKVEGDILVALELYKDLGEGRLLFRTYLDSGSTFHRKASEGKWVEATGKVGLYLHGMLLN